MFQRKTTATVPPLAVLAAMLAGGLGACVGSADAPAAALRLDRCAGLAGLELIDFDVVTATPMSVDGDLPAHCLVHGLIDTEINFELLLPDDWNGRFVMGGGGGYVGTVQNSALPTALERGYATVGTDTGHAGNGIEAGWALDNPERRVNFGYRAVHLTAEAARSVIRHYYDRAEEYSYFVGCSRGGGQGMMESQRYPSDFDGIVAGAPAYHWTGLTAGFVQNQQALFPDASDLSAPVVTAENRALLASSVLEACDHLDGVTDGILNDPRVCDFTPDALPRCQTESAGPHCVTTDQLAAMQVIYGGPTSNGSPIHPGFPLGGEDDPGGWDTWIAGVASREARMIPNLHYGFGTELYKYFVFGDPAWDYTRYDFSTWTEDVAETAEILNATESDLGPFRDAGGKIIFWTGWSDPALTALGTIDYYERVQANDAAVREYARLFMLPGVLHCGGGPGPDNVDWLRAIEDWVERDTPPRRLLATRLGEGGEPVMTRPVCAYPEVAVYGGTGPTDDQASFRCEAP